MTKTTITEALQELKTIKDRMQKISNFINANLGRTGDRVDPLEKDGGSTSILLQKLQSRQDLAARFIKIRATIQQKNLETMLTISLGDGKPVTMSIAHWLSWKRDLARDTGMLYSAMALTLQKFEEANLRQPDKAKAYVFHLSPEEIYKLSDEHTQMEGLLDGKLSLLNAITHIEIPD